MVDNDLKVIVKAKDLAKHSFLLTSNCNRYPKKYKVKVIIAESEKQQIEEYNKSKRKQLCDYIDEKFEGIMNCL